MNTIQQYRDAKDTYFRLQAQAKKDLLTRFHQLEAEIAQVQRELRDDFGVTVSVNLKSRQSKTSKNVAPKPDPPPSLSAKTTDAEKLKKIKRLERMLSTQRDKLADAVSNKTVPVRSINDRIYELEDELRLAKEA